MTTLEARGNNPAIFPVAFWNEQTVTYDGQPVEVRKHLVVRYDGTVSSSVCWHSKGVIQLRNSCPPDVLIVAKCEGSFVSTQTCFEEFDLGGHPKYGQLVEETS